MSETQKKIIVAIVLFNVPIMGMTIDLYVPSLPAISLYFHIAPRLSQMTLSTYLFGFAIVQLFIGSLSDSIGRKKPYIIGMLLYIIATVFIVVMGGESIYVLLWLRFFQGIGAGVVSVPLRAIMSDLYTGHEYFKKANYVVLAWSIGPIIAPAIGGYLQHYFGWHACFYFLSIYGAVGFILYLIFVPETLKNITSVSVGRFLLTYKTLLSSSEFLAGLFIMGSLYSILILFNTVAPFLVQVELHYSAISYGHMALFMGIAWFLGGTTNRLLSEIDMQHKINLGLLLMLLDMLVAFGLNHYYGLNIYLVIGSVFVLLFCAGLIYPNFFAKCTVLFPEFVGSTLAFATGIAWLISSICGAVGTHLKANSATPLDCGFLALIVVSYVCFIIQYHLARKRELQ